MVRIADYLHEELVFFLDEKKRDDVLWRLIDGAVAAGKLKDKETFFTAIIGRERIVSTGIGMGVALPHAKISGYDQFFIAIAVLDEGAEWNAIDEAPVRIVLMIGGPDDKQTEYLQILSALTQTMRDINLRKNLLKEKTPSGILKIFEKSHITKVGEKE